MVSVTVVSGLTECSIMFNDKDVLYVSEVSSTWAHGVGQFLIQIQNFISYKK